MRKIVQISSYMAQQFDPNSGHQLAFGVVALCDDGTVWDCSQHNEWIRLPDIPVDVCADGFAAGIRAAAAVKRGLAAEWSAEAKRLAALPVPVGDDWKNKHIYRADALSQCASQLVAALPTPENVPEVAADTMDELCALLQAYSVLGAIAQDDADPREALDSRMSAFDCMRFLDAIIQRSKRLPTTTSDAPEAP